MLECNKNQTILALNYTLKNSNKTISASKIKRRCKKNIIKPLKRSYKYERIKLERILKEIYA